MLAVTFWMTARTKIRAENRVGKAPEDYKVTDLSCRFVGPLQSQILPRTQVDTGSSAVCSLTEECIWIPVWWERES